ncbi:MAG: hypothetical protein M0P95_12135 [Sulfuritalea sp.]|jgi:integrase|nr:hypothetical protein [Sulfuritalea sp.]
MGDFFCRRDNDGEERWWLEITGKGDKIRLVPATNELMVELARYRRENRLTPFTVPGESTPLLLPVGWQTAAADPKCGASDREGSLLADSGTNSSPWP